MFKSGHHTLFNRLEWTLRPDAKILREQPSLIKRIPWELHQEIHAHVPPVPLLGYHALKRTLSLFEPQNTTTRSMENLMKGMIEAAAHPKSHDIETQLALLAVEAVDLQRPFIANSEAAERTFYVDLGEYNG